MAVASPYAVFRAVDLGWPPSMPAVQVSLDSAPRTKAARPSTPPRKRLRSSGDRQARTPQGGQP